MTKNEAEVEAWIEKQWNEMGNTMIYCLVVLTACVFYTIYAFGNQMLPTLILLAAFYVIPFYWCSRYGYWKVSHPQSSYEQRIGGVTEW